MRPDGILHAVIDLEDPPTAEHASECVEVGCQLSRESVPPVNLEIIRVPYADRSVRQFRMEEMEPPPCRAVATVDQALVTIFRTCQQVESPEVPTEVFRNVAAAVEWIEAQTAVR